MVHMREVCIGGSLFPGLKPSNMEIVSSARVDGPYLQDRCLR